MKKFLFVTFTIFSLQTHAAEQANLTLRGRVLSTIQSSMNRLSSKGKNEQWFMKISSNQGYSYERHKIEIKGLDQLGILSNFDRIANENKQIRHELLINFVAENAKPLKPIFINISAN